MRVLLVSPINRSYVIMPSLGLGYLAAVCRQAGHDVSMLHCLKEGYTFDDFALFLKQNAFDVIALQMFSFDVNPVKRHIALAKEIQPNAFVVVGGYHPSGDPEGVLDTLPLADAAMASEAELAFPALLRELGRRKPDWKSVPNLIWRQNGKIRINPVCVVDHLDEIPFPAWDLMDPRLYPEAPHGAFFKSFPTAPIVCTRGCPFVCTFCSGKAVTTQKVRRRSAQNIVREMEFLKNTYGVRDFLIEDENFTAHKTLVREFCTLLLERNLGIHWNCPSGVRLDTLDLDMLKLMERSGCYSLSVGIEFGTQAMLDLTRKKLTLETIRHRLDLIRQTRIKITGFFMFGVPGETKSHMEETIRFACSLPIDRAQFNNFMPLPGSEIYRTLKHQFRELDYDRFFVHDVAYVPQGMTRAEMKNLQRRAYLRFYLRPAILAKLLLEISSPKHLYRLIKRFWDAMH